MMRKSPANKICAIWFFSALSLILLGCIHASSTSESEAVSKARIYELWEPAPAPNRGHDFSIEQPGRGYPYDEDWERWSYPLGNGMLGANVFGRTDVERIQLSEKTFANGSAYNRGGMTNAAELYLDIGHEGISHYRRALNLNDAIESVSYQSAGVAYEREYFTSYPDDVMVIRLTADQAGALSFTVRPEIPYLEAKNEKDTKSGTVTAEGDTITLAGTLDYYQVNFEIQVKVLPEGGALATGDSTIRVENADAVTLLVAVDTNYELGPQIFLNGPKEKLDPNFDPHALVAAKIAQATKLGFDKLKERHLEDYRGLFGRVAVNLNSEVSDLPTHQLLEAYKNGDRDNYLEELFFQYNRYLLIASSRETTLPANLQGAWTQYEVSPWCAGYWHNINVQMNYWGAMTTNLAETFEAYLNYFKAYKPQAQLYAREYIKDNNPSALSNDPKENGWILGTGANAYQISGSSTHSGPGTGGFTTQLLMEYYNFTQDEDFLRETGYPAMLEMSKFFDKALKETEDGLLLISPSASPEIKNEDGTYHVTEGCTYDQAFVWQNHNNVLLAAEALGRDDPFLQTIRAELPRLDPIQIGSSGQIKEFREEDAYGEIGDPLHRHISQLCGLYPGTLINALNPAWMQAASKTLELRGPGTTGWSIMHRMLCHARLKEAEHAHDRLVKLISEKTGENLWTHHPPFQIDANLGSVAGVAEMLLQSHQGFIEPIPALPEAWETGSFDGLVARGNFEVSAQWQEGKLKQLSVHSRSGKVCDLKYPRLAYAKVTDSSGERVPATSDALNRIRFSTEKGETYTIHLKPDTVVLDGEVIELRPKKYEPTLRDVAYGPHERNKLDLWQAKSDQPTPLVFYIHGGGWVAGSKEANSGPSLTLLDQGVSYVSINYRLARDENVLPCSLHDAARALQFVRSKAEEWNIDPDRIITSGGSAGGCSSLWLAYHDDLADPESDDPVARESTRVLGAAAIVAQSTINPWVVKERLGPSAFQHEMIWRTVGAPSPEALLENWEQYKDLSIEASPITHVSKDDPPVFIVYGNNTPAPPETGGIHHVEFGRILQEACEPLGLSCTIKIAGKDTRQDALDKFILERLNLKK